MAPNLRLLCVMTSTRYDGLLSEVDAIIGAPLHMPIFPADKEMDDVNSRAREDLLLSLLIAHGWIVELIIAFAEQSKAELRAKCVMRVDNLLQLSAQISSLFSQIPLWSEAIFDLYNGTAIGTGNGSAAHAACKAKSRPKKKRLKDAWAVRPGDRGSQEWQKYFRQLNWTALSLIHGTGPISFRLTETEPVLREEAPSFKTTSLSPKALQYLLTELFTQVETARARITLDLVAIPFIVLTCLVLRDIFNKVFVEALATSTGMRFFTRGYRSPSLPLTQEDSSSYPKAE